MNYWEAGTTDIQIFDVTPRAHKASSIAAFTADTTLVTADATIYTADQTVYGSNSVYTVVYSKDGRYTNQSTTATGDLKGEVLTLSTQLDVDVDSFYYYKVYIDGREIYRGKSFTYDVLPNEPLHYSMYD